MGARDSRGGRQSVDGILVVDKPSGMTSHDVVAAARRALGESRIGHTGTLDPLATGVLPLACGRATRLVRFLSSDTKEYEAVVRFGVATDTYDVTGSVTSRTDVTPTAGEIEAALATLRGDYLQMPPAFSAKKVAGRRAYAMARQQQSVVLTPVPVRVTRAELLRLDGSTAVFAITCSAGFYVRSFAHTLGQDIGTGACLDALRRTRSGSFTLAAAATLDDLLRSGEGRRIPLVPLADLLPGLPAVRLTDEAVRRVAHGREVGDARIQESPGRLTSGEPVSAPDDASWVRMLAPDGRLVAVGRASASGALHPSIVLI